MSLFLKTLSVKTKQWSKNLESSSKTVSLETLERSSTGRSKGKMSFTPARCRAAACTRDLAGVWLLVSTLLLATAIGAVLLVLVAAIAVVVVAVVVAVVVVVVVVVIVVVVVVGCSASSAMVLKTSWHHLVSDAS